MPRKPSGKPIGRPKAFCEQRALEAAMRVFAEKGYENASMCDLTDAMGINRFSMYASFGNKEALYVKAMERFSQASRDNIAACLAGESGRESIQRLLLSVVERFTDPEHGVCFITQAPISPDAVCPETRKLLTTRRSEIEQTIRRRIEQAIQDGELPAPTNATDLAAFYAVMIQGFALQAQHGGKRQELFRVVDFAMSKWPEKLDTQSARSA